MLGEFRTIVYDCEVFAADWLFVFKEDDRYTSFWNDARGLTEYIGENEDALFAGYNSSHYDQYILKAVLAGCDPTEVKEVNDSIIGDDALPWEHPYLEGFYFPFNDVDLMKDVQAGTSLKSIEAHIGMSVEESSVPFDIDRALTGTEREEVERYCRHDVDATERLLGMRESYLLTKMQLGRRAGIPEQRAAGMTNAKLTAAVLGAVRAEHDDEREYEYPSNLLREWVPEEAFAFFDRVRDRSVPEEELWRGKLELEVGGCPVVLGFGGIHGALPRWGCDAGGGVRMVNADVASYYPSLMVRNGYTSRNMARPDAYRAIYEERLKAKAAGDKATADALKLVVNTAYGATLNRWNDLYDPLMARSVCISGQLYLLELACHLAAAVPGLRLVQLNTDGVLVQMSDSDEAASVFTELTGEWQKRTGFALEFDEVARIRQKDVNNYAMLLEGGGDKVKGGYLVRGTSSAGAFSVNNNAVAVADAVRGQLLFGKPAGEIVRACRDPSAFQLVAKAGHKYSEVWQEVSAGHGEDGEERWERLPRQKCNRVFAARDGTLGRLFKRKKADGGVAKVESLPERCLVRNGPPPAMEEIDVEWYAALAEKRVREFESEDDMAETTQTAAKAAKTPAKRGTAKTAKANVYGKLAAARRMFLDARVRKSGVNRHLEFEYWTLDDITPTQTRIFEQVGLIELFTFVPGRRAPEGGWHEEPAARARVVNIDDPDDYAEFSARWTDLPVQTNSQGRRASNELQEYGKAQTYLRRYVKMLVLDLAEPDQLDAEIGEPAKREAPAAKPKASRPATAAERKKAAEEVTAPEGAASSLQVNQLKKQLKKVKDTYGAAHPEVGAYLVALGAETQNLKSITKERCEQAIRDLGEMKERFETEGGGAK